MQVEFHPEARAEFRSTALWYEERQVGLGETFVTAVNTTLERIANSPESFPQWPGTTQAARIIRKATLSAFPYLIAFEQHLHHVLVLGVAHQKRRPLYWLRRASPITE